MRQNYKKLTLILSVVLFIINSYHTTHASYIIDTTIKRLEGPGENMILDVGITGDSYGGFLIDSLTEVYSLDLANYCKAGSTIKENKDNIIECIHDKYKYIVISIGVNDHLAQTPIEDFIDQINFFAELGKKLHKYIIFHTYMSYPTESLCTKSYPCDAYDKALQAVTSINSHVKYIDMHDINGEIYYQEDHIHYNKNFYKILIHRLLDTLEEIKKER